MLYDEHVSGIKKAIDYIETHLKDNLSLQQIAEQSLFSKYHFHRIFQSITGVTVADYIRKRRLTNAAYELTKTNRRIIDIAIDYHFSTQESFTRAFQKTFYMTPGRYRMYSLKLTNELRGGAIMISKLLPDGWIAGGSHPTEYKIGMDDEHVHQGTLSGCIASKKDEANGFATMMQMFKSDNYKGSRLRLSGFIKVQDVEQWAGLWMRIDGKDGETLQFDNMMNRPIKGSTNWNQYSVVLDVPKDSTAIAFGFLLSGKGTIWVDSLRFDIVDEKVPTTNIEENIELPNEPVNLNFDFKGSMN